MMRQSSLRSKSLAIAAALLVAGGLTVPCSGQNDRNRSLEPVDDVTPQSQLDPDSFYALVIGNNQYQNLNKLATAENDATEVAKVLSDNYGFKVTLLLSATRNQILTAMNGYRRSLTENSSLLIYYGGHGIEDTESKVAYWVPVDGTSDNPVNWISASDITADLRAIPTRHVLIISDSCYSGGLAGSRTVEWAITPNKREAEVLHWFSLKSRTLMASGGLEPVTDAGKNNHSVFANALLDGLNEMPTSEFTARELFYQEVYQVVAGNSQQHPDYEPIMDSGHNLGDFVFLRRGTVRKVSGTPPILPPKNPEFDAIESALHKYEDAYGTESVDELKKVWPGMTSQQEKNLKKDFNRMHALKVQINCKDDPAITGQEARLNCSQGMRYTEDGKLKPWQRAPVDMTLTKKEDGWQVAKVQEKK